MAAARSRHCDRGCTGRGCREQAQVNAAMVKISFQPAVAGIKADKADKAAASGPASASAPAAEILLTPAREERPPRHRSRKGGSVGGVCYLSMGMVVLLMGLVFASVYIYRYFFLAQLARDNFFHCGVLYEDSLSSQIRTRLELEEDVKIYLEENYERINVPVPQFGGGDPADIIHDFQRGLTAYHDISLDKCYVIELNTTIVLPPRNFWELLMNVKRGTYLPQTYIIQEEMVVTEHVRDKEALGSFIYHLCNGKDTYRLRRRSTRRRINKRGGKNCNAIRHFENTFVGGPGLCISLPSVSGHRFHRGTDTRRLFSKLLLLIAPAWPTTSGNLWEEPRGGKCCFALQKEENFITQHKTSATRNQK